MPERTSEVRAAPGKSWTAEWGYRPHLDGLRAIAVYLVVAFHAGADRLAGGFIGVDVFFVLSGYLVTQVLLRSMKQSGSIGLGRFYSRRFRRLLPAAAVVLVATPLVYSLIASPIELTRAKGAMRAASLYFSNWYFIGQSNDYFAADVQRSPVLQFWSLSVEEQFYVAWPLLLGGLMLLARRAGERSDAVVRAVVAAAILLSLGLAIWISQTNVNRAYYGTDTRAYQLLAGALVALSPGAIAWIAARRDAVAGSQPVLRLIPAIALVLLAVSGSSLLNVGAVKRGVIATAVTLVLIMSLEVSSGGVRWLLSTSPFVYLGRISYSTYLWHWLVILVIGAKFEVGPMATTLLATAVATGLASASYQLLEMPFRQSKLLDRFPLGLVAVGLATSLLLGLVITPRLLDVSAKKASAPKSDLPAGFTPVPAGLDLDKAAADHGEFPPCRVSDPTECTRVEGGSPHIMLIGDSNARMYLPLFEAFAKEENLTLSAAIVAGCLWPEGIWRTFALPGQMPCEQRQREWYQSIVPALKPDVVFLVHRAVDDANSPAEIEDKDAGVLDIGSKEYRDTYEKRTRATVKMFRDLGSKVVIIEPAPVTSPKNDPMICLSGAAYLEACRFRTIRVPTTIEQIYREVAADDPMVWTINLDTELCPKLPICDPVVNGMVVRWDPAHITTTFGRSLLPWLQSTLGADGVPSP